MDEITTVLVPLQTFLTQLVEFLPRFILAVIIVFAGWLIAKALRLGVLKGLRRINFHVVTSRAGMDHFLQQGGATADTSKVLAILVYWLVIFAALILASNTLGLAYVTDFLTRIALFLPRAIIAVFVFALGAYFAYFLDNTISSYGKSANLTDAEFFGRLVRYTVLIFTSLIALEQLGIGGDIIRNSFLIILAGIVFALALAFGLGGRRWAEGLLERWWPNRDERVDTPRFRD